MPADREGDLLEAYERSSAKTPASITHQVARAATRGARALSCLVALAVLATLAGCARTPADSGVKGIVTIGPTSPVQQQGQSGEAPYEATIVVRDSSGRTAAEVRSLADGHYIAYLAPGRYTLVPQSPGVLPRANTYEVVVKPHQFSEVDIQYDSGIR